MCIYIYICIHINARTRDVVDHENSAAGANHKSKKAVETSPTRGICTYYSTHRVFHMHLIFDTVIRTKFGYGTPENNVITAGPYILETPLILTVEAPHRVTMPCSRSHLSQLYVLSKSTSLWRTAIW